MDALDALKLTESDTAVETALEQSGLDQAAFLTIFLAQLENQDPLNPQSSDELASQLAQFSQLEQSIRSMTELVGINERLDRLIDASGSETSFGLDPVALLGHEVDIGFRLPDFGSSQALRMELDDASTSLRIQVNDLNGDALGLAEIMGTSEDGEAIDLPAGTYQLIFDNQEPRLIVPDGTESSIRFFTLIPSTLSGTSAPAKSQTVRKMSMPETRRCSSTTPAGVRPFHETMNGTATSSSNGPVFCRHLCAATPSP